MHYRIRLLPFFSFSHHVSPPTFVWRGLFASLQEACLLYLVARTATLLYVLVSFLLLFFSPTSVILTLTRYIRPYPPDDVLPFVHSLFTVTRGRFL